MENNYFEKLNDINVTEKIEKKNGLSYLSWAYAWGEIKKQHPSAQYKVYENPDGWNYFTDKRTCWVKVSVTIEGLEHIEYLPVMDARNRSIPLDSVTSFDVNKAIQRAITKACARHGLGLYIYAGEDLPENELTEGGKNQQQQEGQQDPNPQPTNTAPTVNQLAELKKVKRTVAHVAKHFGIDEKAVTAQHVSDYIAKAAEYQKKKEEEQLAQAEKEAQDTFPPIDSADVDFSDPSYQ